MPTAWFAALMLAGAMAAANAAAPARRAVEVAIIEGDGVRVLRQEPGSDTWNAVERPEAFRIASITKTYVAATVLRLVETGRLGLDDRLSDRLSSRTLARLADDGYAVGDITLRQLLSHTAGLPDPTHDPRFIRTWMERASTHWTRDDHLRALVDWTDPLHAPGTAFAYSDSGYVLLGEVVERATGEPLATAVRRLLRLEDAGMRDTWWEQVEEARRPRAHQYMGGIDTHDWSPSLDLYGGGGLVATTADVARFFHRLFAGCVFDSPATLATMVSSDGLPDGSPYRLGIFEYRVAGRAMYGHSGYWGTWVAFDPLTRDTVAVAVREQHDARQLLAIATSYFERRSAGLRPDGKAARVARSGDGCDSTGDGGP
jgi:D-alanyl-D-alanine carboxypeptidase